MCRSFVGNGGFSLRRVDAMRACCGQHTFPEDLYFVRCLMGKRDQFTVAPVEDAERFAAEGYFDLNEAPMGIHKPHVAIPAVGLSTVDLLQTLCPEFEALRLNVPYDTTFATTPTTTTATATATTRTKKKTTTTATTTTTLPATPTDNSDERKYVNLLLSTSTIKAPSDDVGLHDQSIAAASERRSAMTTTRLSNDGGNVALGFGEGIAVFSVSLAFVVFLSFRLVSGRSTIAHDASSPATATTATATATAATTMPSVTPLTKKTANVKERDVEKQHGTVAI